jgi:DNA polymerase III epsilon subunit family exonuclease
LDVETTGLSPQNDAIIELAACVVDQESLEERRTFHSRIFSEKRVAPSAFRVHGIASSDLVDEPQVMQVVAKFDTFAPKDSILCGHNVAFDVAFLKATYERTGLPFGFDYHLLDIWSVAFFVLGARAKKLPSYNLTALCSLFGIERDPSHNALQDVRASAAILRHLYSAARGNDMEVLGQFTFRL